MLHGGQVLHCPEGCASKGQVDLLPAETGEQTKPLLQHDSVIEI